MREVWLETKFIAIYLEDRLSFTLSRMELECMPLYMLRHQALDGHECVIPHVGIRIRHELHDFCLAPEVRHDPEMLSEQLTPIWDSLLCSVAAVLDELAEVMG